MQKLDSEEAWTLQPLSSQPKNCINITLMHPCLPPLSILPLLTPYGAGVKQLEARSIQRAGAMSCGPQ